MASQGGDVPTLRRFWDVKFYLAVRRMAISDPAPFPNVRGVQGCVRLTYSLSLKLGALSYCQYILEFRGVLVSTEVSKKRGK